VFDTLTNSAANDNFIVKYDSSGVALWAKNISGIRSQRPVSMVVDSTGNIYVSGYFESDTLRISASLSLTNYMYNDIFIVKYLSDGTANWARKIGGNANDQPVSMAIDSTGNIYVSGYYESSTLNMPGFSPNIFTRFGINDTIILKYNSSGTAQWAKNIGGTLDDRPVSMVVDSTGNVYVSGFYNSSTLNIPEFSPDNLTNSGSGTNDTFILKYSADGTPQWARSIGGTATDQPVNMVLDATGNLYVSGFYGSATLVIYNGATVFDTLTNSGSGTNDTFILKYSADGTPQWAKNIGGTATDQPVNMVLDATGNLYVSGFYGSATLNIPGFTPNTLTNSSSGTNDTFILKYSADGTGQWAKNIGGSGSELPVNMISDSTGNLYISGTYTSPSITFN
jgi:hypothetical protein